MTRLRVILFRLRALVRSRRLDREIDDEIASHLAEATEEYIRQGLAPAEAYRAAQRDFGGVARAEEVCREVRSFAWLEDSARDLRYALRTLRRSPTFATAAVATLALAIGVNTAMFSVVNAVVLQPLPYRSPGQLALLWTEDPAQQLREGRSALWDVEKWRSQSRSFADMATFDSVSTTLTETDRVEQIVGASVSPNLLPLLGVRPVAGRGFSTEEAEERQRVVLISHRFWQARFGGSYDVLGASLVLNGVACRIVGILPAGFQIARLAADVWQPHPTARGMRGPDTWFVVARLRPGVSFDQAQVEMSAIARRLNDQLPAADRTGGISVVPLSRYLVGPRSRQALWMLGGAVLCLFLMAVANVSSLALARGAARSREIAVRAALGASAGRIARQLLAESVLLAVVSGVIGTLLAFGAIRLVRAFGPSDLPRLGEASLDPRVLGWAVVVSLLAAVLVALAPAITTLRRDPHPCGEDGGRSVAGGTSSRRIRRALVVAEHALAIVLLVGAGLLIRSWRSVTRIDPGFRPERVLVVEVSPPTGYSVPAQRINLYLRVLEETRTLPGVESAAIIDDLFAGNPREQLLTVERDGETVSERLRLTRDEASEDFFQTIGTPLLRGRLFSADDRPEASPVAIINDAMARRSWPGQDPVGSRFKLGPPDSGGPWHTVVGVVGDMRRQGPERDALPQIFVSLAQGHPPRDVALVIRTSSDDPLATAAAVRAAVRRVDKDAPIFGVALLEQQLGSYLAQRRFQTALLTSFSVAALLMAAVGIYGLIQYSVATRTRELGLRMAMGAEAGDIFRLVILEGIRLSLTGVALGLVAAWWLGRAGSSLLSGVTAGDPLTFTTVVVLLTAVAVAACCLPVWRAVSADPMRALRLT